MDPESVTYNVIVPILTVWTCFVFVYSWSRDHTDRVLMLLEATANEKDRKDSLFLKLQRHWEYILLSVNFFQYCGIVIMDGVPWHMSFINPILEFIIGNLDFVQDDIALSVFFIIWSTYALLLGSALVRFLYEKCTGNETEVSDIEQKLRELFLGLVFIPCANLLFMMLACSFDDEDDWDPADGEFVPAVSSVKNLACFRGPHIVYAVMSLLSLVIVYPAACYHELTTNTSDQAYQYVPKFRLLDATWEFCGPAIGTFLADSPWIAVPMTTVVLIGLATYTLLQQPCLASGRRINQIGRAHV